LILLKLKSKNFKNQSCWKNFLENWKKLKKKKNPDKNHENHENKKFIKQMEISNIISDNPKNYNKTITCIKVKNGFKTMTVELPEPKR